LCLSRTERQRDGETGYCKKAGDFTEKRFGIFGGKDWWEATLKT